MIKPILLIIKKIVILLAKLLLGLIVLIALFFAIGRIEFIPYGFELGTFQGYSYIREKEDAANYIMWEGNYLTLQDDYDALQKTKDTLAFNKTHPMLEKMKKYANNELGLVVYVQASDGKHKYIAIKPKSKEQQKYVGGTEVNYTIYSEEEYKKLGIKDWWWNIW